MMFENLFFALREIGVTNAVFMMCVSRRDCVHGLDEIVCLVEILCFPNQTS
jgi:hypothetical protein